MTYKGTFVLVDISGYSQYLDKAGLQHASKVTAKLLNALIEANRNRWQVANLEGDCIFYFREGHEPLSELLAHIRSLFECFFTRVLETGQDTDCGCGACGGANQLALKFIVHAGEYAEQRIGGRRDLIGADVVTAHRLLKSDTPFSEYVLLTRSYLGDDTLGEYPVSEGILKTEGGSVPFAVIDLTPIRREAELKNEIYVSSHEAIAQLEAEIGAPPATVWDAILDADKMRQWSDVGEIFIFPARMGKVGTVYRFILPDGHDFVQLVLAVDEENRRVTLRRSDIPFVRYFYSTYEVSERSDGATTLRCYLGADTALPALPRLLSALGRRDPRTEPATGLQRLKAYCEGTA